MTPIDCSQSCWPFVPKAAGRCACLGEFAHLLGIIWLWEVIIAKLGRALLSKRVAMLHALYSIFSSPKWGAPLRKSLDLILFSNLGHNQLWLFHYFLTKLQINNDISILEQIISKRLSAIHLNQSYPMQI